MIYAPVPNAYRIACDSCEQESDAGFESFKEAVEWAKNNGWKSKFDQNTREWEHECPSCRKDSPAAL